MLNEDHNRVARLLRGERRLTDFDRLFADLRMVTPGRASVHEIGNFAAHRGERDMGTVELSVSGESNLDLAETARAVSLGWPNGSPMLRTAQRSRPAAAFGRGRR